MTSPSSRSFTLKLAQPAIGPRLLPAAALARMDQIRSAVDAKCDLASGRVTFLPR